MRPSTPQSSGFGRPSSTPPQGGSPTNSRPADAALQASAPKLPSPDDAWLAWKRSGSDDDLGVAVRALDPVIRKGLSAFGGGQEHLLTRARIIARGALLSYDPDRPAEAADGGKPRGKASLDTHVYGHLRRLQRVAADRSEAVRLPERVRMDAIVAREAAERWRDAHDGDDPDLLSLQEATGLSRQRLAAASRAYRELSSAGLDTDKGDTLLQMDAEEEADPWRDYVYHDLDQKSRRVFELATGYGGSKTVSKSEIAKRLGLTPAAVSGRIATIVRRLSERPAGGVR